MKNLLKNRLNSMEIKMDKIKSGDVYLPKKRIKNGFVYSNVYVTFIFLWWAKIEDTTLGITRWVSKKKFLEEYKYGWYIPTHQEMG